MEAVLQTVCHALKATIVIREACHGLQENANLGIIALMVQWFPIHQVLQQQVDHVLPEHFAKLAHHLPYAALPERITVSRGSLHAWNAHLVSTAP